MQIKKHKKFLIFKGCKKNIEPLPAYGWFTLMYGKNKHIIKQLSSN